MGAARVLIVDDSSLARAVIAESVRALGLEVVGEAADGIQALDMYRRLRPDVVTMDVTMPGLDGVSALRSIVELDPKARVVVVSVAGQEEVVLQAMQAGAIGFLLKPFEPSQLMRLLERSGGVNAHAPADAERRRLYVVEAQRRIEAMAEDVRDLAAAPDDRGIIDSIRRHSRALGGMAVRIDDQPVARVADGMERLISSLRVVRGAAAQELASLLNDAVFSLHKLLLAASRGEDDHVYAEAFRQRLDAWGQAARASGTTSEGSLKVLIVDPDRFVRRVLEGFLTREGMLVSGADSIGDGVDRARIDKPALVIVNCDSPSVDGPAAIRRFRAEPATMYVPVLMITPRDDLSEKLSAFAAGADDVVVWPFEPEEVVARVTAMIARTRRGAPTPAPAATPPAAATP